MTTTPTLEGHGVQLIPCLPSHVDALLRTQDAETWAWMSERGATPALMQALIARGIAQAKNGAAHFWTTIVLHEHMPPEVAGSSRLADLDLHHRRGEIGWTWVAPKYRGAGLNPRVKFLQLEHAFETLGLRRVALKTHHGNTRSQLAILKLGAQFEGTFRNHMFQPDGSSRDTKWYSILDGEWPGVKQQLLERIARHPLQPAPAPTNG